MSTKSAVNGVSGVSGLNSCKCCPYGFHIDTDFVNYCESLVTALYGSNKRYSQTLQCRTSNSLRRKINSAFSTLSSRSAPNATTDAFLSYCDYNYNNITDNGLNSHHIDNKPKSQSLKQNNCLDRESINSVINDYSLGDAVDQFEEAWNESNRRLSNVSDSESLIKLTMSDIERPSSPPPSPAPSSCTSSNISRVVLSQIRDQMAMSLTRVKELEDQVKHIPNLRQKVIVLREEKKKLVQKLEGEEEDINGFNNSHSRARIRELEKIGLITPPVMRRKLLLKTDSDTEDDEFGDIWMRSSPPPSKMISSKNIRLEELNDKIDSSIERTRQTLEVISVSTNTEMTSKAPVVDCSTNTEQKQTNENKFSFDILSSISIIPETTAPVVTTHVSKRSIGISTSLAPSLPRKSVAVETELKSRDTISLSELEAQKPVLVSWGTDPIRVDYTHAQCQASPKSADVSTRTEAPTFKNSSISCNPRDFGIKVNWSQTDRKVLANKTIQCSQSCRKCELKQTETVGVGDNNVYGNTSTDKSVTTDREPANRPTSLEGLLSVSPVSRASSAQSIRLCDKCNDAITSVAKDFVIGPYDPKISSPTTQSRIPRPIHSTGSLERRTINDKIIEETANEILVYKNPSLSVGSSPLKRNPPLKLREELSQKSYLLKNKDLSPKTKEAIKVIDDVFKISESDESEDESSASSDEGTYEVESGAVAKPVVRKRAEPSKEIKAALKVLNDNLIKPEKANKSALLKSLSIIEKEWFKVAADKGSDSHAVEDYIDCFETYSKHLLNRVVNLDDKSGNTAIHYAISHNNFDIVSVLLDSKVCDVNKTNKAGYTATMLVSLAKVHNETQKAVIRRLFQLGDVNIKAKQNGQTALMLAGSHGQFFTCKILLECGAAINLQDNDGSTALMCAAEHGHTDVVRLLLSHPDCDPTIVDNDCSTALKIAMANNHNDIGLMLYASTSMLSRGSSPYASLRRTQSKAIAASLRRTGSFSYGHSRVTPHNFQLAPSPPPRSRHSSTSTTRSAKN